MASTMGMRGDSDWKPGQVLRIREEAWKRGLYSCMTLDQVNKIKERIKYKNDQYAWTKDKSQYQWMKPNGQYSWIHEIGGKKCQTSNKQSVLSNLSKWLRSLLARS